jgi:methyl-accepting chemotaxis protein
VASQDQRLLKASLDLVAPAADQLVAALFDRLFTDHPYLRPMFPTRLEAQRDRFLQAIVALVTHYDRPEALLPALTAMGRRHEGYGVSLGDYAAVGRALLVTLREFAGPAWHPEYEAVWARAYTFAAGTMMQAGALSYHRMEDDRLAA